MLAGGSHCNTLPSVKIFVCDWSDQGHLCIGQRTRGTNCWVLTNYVGSVLTGNNKQFFWTSLLYHPKSSSCYAMVLSQTLACLILKEPLKKFLPIALFPYFVIFVATVCLPLGKVLSEPMLAEQGFGGGDELPMLWLLSEQGDWTFGLVLWSWCKQHTPHWPLIWLLLFMSIMSINVYSFHPCSAVSPDASTCRRFHSYFIPTSLNVTNVYSGYRELITEKRPTAEVPLLKQPTCCELINSCKPASQSKHLCHSAVDCTGSVKFSTCLIIMKDVSHCWVPYSSMRGQSPGQWNKIQHSSWKEMKLNINFWRNTNKW